MDVSEPDSTAALTHTPSLPGSASALERTAASALLTLSGNKPQVPVKCTAAHCTRMLREIAASCASEPHPVTISTSSVHLTCPQTHVKCIAPARAPRTRMLRDIAAGVHKKSHLAPRKRMRKRMHSYTNA